MVLATQLAQAIGALVRQVLFGPPQPKELTFIARTLVVDGRHTIVAHEALPTGHSLMIVRTCVGAGHVYTAFYRLPASRGGLTHAVAIDPARPAIIEVGNLDYPGSSSGPNRRLKLTLIDNPIDAQNPQRVRMYTDASYAWGGNR